MSSSQSDFINSNLALLKYSSKQDIIENLFIKSLIESYDRINKMIGVENEIRDRFIKDLYTSNSEILKWLQIQAIYLDWENWVFWDGLKLARTDITFKFSGLQFIIECKRLKNADQAYIEEGLSRFINLKYAKGDEFAGMIGFVISGNKITIANELNSKIDALSHTNSISGVSSVPSFNSTHKRINNTEIGVYHFFFDFSHS